ncbi:MAG TPA: nuclear transport factor 2 family protein [Candidatus Hydrogenedentes bacterium]|nr:nuclear transport factor 2 family protein [Candidatus Hydrogenedentota bacterium]
MEQDQVTAFAERFMSAWNTQDSNRVLECYSDDLCYRDPGTSEPIHGSEAFRKYLGKLFAKWTMHWAFREGYPLAAQEGCVLLWHARFQKTGGNETVELDGMDLVLLCDDKIIRNEVYFDRTGLLAMLHP